MSTVFFCYTQLMEIKKSIQLTTEPLETLLKNGKSLDFRLDQEAWRELQAGDYVEYWEDFTGWQKGPTEDARRVIVRIEKKFLAPTFLELFDVIGKDLERLEDRNALLSNLKKWWTEEKEKEHGTLAFYVKVV